MNWFWIPVYVIAALLAIGAAVDLVRQVKRLWRGETND